MNQGGYRETVMRQSYVFNVGSNVGSMGSVNRSFISTAINSDSGEANGVNLRKSQIQQLPSYKKSNLGDNVQFIVVFQTIEIQRLSQEIEILRVKAKEYQRQLINANNYEVQIRELSEKCYAQEKDIYDFREEYEKLNKICETMYHENEMLKNKLSQMDFGLKQKYEAERHKNNQLQTEIEKWKNRYQAAERSKIKELDDLRAMMESQRKSMIDRQIREMAIRHQNERSSLQNQIRKVRQLLDNRGRDIEDFRQKCQKQEILIMELRNYENIINDHQNKLALLNQELLRLNELLRQKDEENNTYRQREFKTSQQLKSLQEWEFEGKNLRGQLQAKSREAEDWKSRAGRLQEEVLKSRELQIYNDELGHKLVLASKQLERLNSILKIKMQQVESWKKRLAQKDNQLSKYKNLENDLFSYENKIKNLNIQNDRINGILKSRMGDIEDWKRKYVQLQDQLQNIQGLAGQKKALEERVGSQVRNNEELKNQLERAEKEITNLKRYEMSLKEAERSNLGLVKEVQRLNGLLKGQAGELNDYRIRYSKVEGTLSEYRSIEVKVRDYQSKIGLLTTELEKLNDLLKERNREIGSLQQQKLELYSKINHYKNYELKIAENEQIVARMQEGNTNLKRQIENWQNKYREAEAKAQNFETSNYNANRQKEKLSSMIKNKSNDYDQLRKEFARLEQQSQNMRTLELACQEQQGYMQTLSADINELERRLKSTEQELEKQRGLTNEFAIKVIVLSSELERLNQEGAVFGKNKSKEFLELQENYSRLESKVQTKNGEIDLLVGRINGLQTRIADLTAHLSKILTEVTKSQQETRILVKSIEEYQDYARRIHILGAEIDRLKGENKGLDEDIRRMRLKYADNMAQERKQEAYNIRIVLMAIEIETLRRKIEEREISVEEMRKSILDPVRRA